MKGTRKAEVRVPPGTTEETEEGRQRQREGRLQQRAERASKQSRAAGRAERAGRQHRQAEVQGRRACRGGKRGRGTTEKQAIRDRDKKRMAQQDAEQADGEDPRAMSDEDSTVEARVPDPIDQEDAATEPSDGVDELQLLVEAAAKTFGYTGVAGKGWIVAVVDKLRDMGVDTWTDFIRTVLVTNKQLEVGGHRRLHQKTMEVLLKEACDLVFGVELVELESYREGRGT